MSEVPGPLELLRALADDDRLRVVGMLALRPRDPADLALLLGITEAALQHHVRILIKAGLVRSSGGMLTLDTSPIRAVMAATAEPRAAPVMVPEDASDEERKVLVAFFEGSTLVKIPSQRRKLGIVLLRLVALFESGRTYSEKEVNELLRVHHPDVATLRRAMVDHGLLSRDRGRYQRS